MFETLAPYIIAGLVVVTGYLFTRWLTVVGVARHWKASAEISFRHNDELSEQIAGMKAEGCAAQGALEEIFNGVTAGGVPHSTLVKRIAEITAEALAEVPVCDHKAQAEEMVAARLNAENWQNLAVESERQAEEWETTATNLLSRAEEAERLLGLANDRLIVERSKGRIP